jgi:uncharacterized protein
MVAVRTCIGCRIRADTSLMLRVVARDDEVVPDPSATLIGRGAWIHPTSECLENAVKRRTFGRALRVTRALDTQHITELVKHKTVGISSEIPQPKG